MFDIVLHQPEIPPNTGNIIRLAANAGARLHLIEPLGFGLADKHLRRAGLDYGALALVRTYPDFDAFMEAVRPPRLYAFTTRGQRRYTDVGYQPNDALLFGAETRGLPQALLDRVAPDARLRLPLVPGNRSLNLANTVAVAVYEAWRQLGFRGGA